MPSSPTDDGLASCLSSPVRLVGQKPGGLVSWWGYGSALVDPTHPSPMVLPALKGCSLQALQGRGSPVPQRHGTAVLPQQPRGARHVPRTASCQPTVLTGLNLISPI